MQIISCTPNYVCLRLDFCYYVATDEGSTEEFIREFKMLRRVGNHTNIINLVGATVKDGTYCA